MKSFRNLLRELRVPVIQAPMAGGYNNPELAEAVIKAGGVASFGFAYTTQQNIRTALESTRSRVKSGHINANFFIFAEPERPVTQNDVDKAMEALRSMPNHENVKLETPKPPYFIDLQSQLENIWDDKLNVNILSFHFGLPPPAVIEKAKRMGKFVGITATCEDEAKEIIDAGADFIVAQGIEAGGHRGVFTSTLRKRQASGQRDEQLTTSALLIRIRELFETLPPEKRIPLVAAGGIMTPQEVIQHVGTAKNHVDPKNPLIRADAVQLGTAFMTMKECPTHPSFKKVLMDKENIRPVALTRAYSGRQANSMVNTFTKSMKDSQDILPHPVQNTLTGPIRQAAQSRGDVEFQALFCGSNYAQCQESTVEEFMSSIEVLFHKR